MRAAFLIVFFSMILAASCTLEGSGSASEKTALASATIVDSNWKADPSFGSSGAIHWTVLVRNNTDKYIEMARVEFTTHDAAGRLVATTFNFVQSIPPGETRARENLADYYGTEKEATFKITDVRFSGQ